MSRTTTDSTLQTYAQAARELGEDTLRTVMSECAKRATHDDDYADAVVSATLAVWRHPEHDIAGVAANACQTAARDRMRRWQTVTPTDTPPEREREDSGSALPALADVLPALPPTDAAILATIAGNELDRILTRAAKRAGDTPARGDAPLVGEFTASAHRDSGSHAAMSEDSARETAALMRAPHAVAARGLAAITVNRRALRVSDVASALGMGKPRTREDSQALRVRACLAWARASVAMGTARAGESVEARAARALSYVSPERNSGAHGQAVWQAWARPAGLPSAVYVAHGFTPDLSGALPAHSLPTDLVGVSEGMPWGAGSAVAYGERETPTALAAKRAARATERDDSARDALAETARARRCQRATVTRDDSGSASAVCACGAGIPLAWDETARAWVHTLTPCNSPAPRLTRAGEPLDGMRCACSRKRGALVLSGGEWCHAPKR